jgi:FixJ family two-component response regulator
MPTPMIAVVEDDPSMRKAMARIVRSLGYQVRAYDSAEAFLGDEAPGPATCMVVDIHLGGRSGLELMKEVARAGVHGPVICVTAMEDGCLQRQAEEAGCVAYLRKPFEAGTLVEAIHRAVEDRGYRNQE